MQASAPVSVILIAYYGDRWLGPCLRTLREAARGRLHLALIDNAGNSRLDALDLSPFDAEILKTPRPMGFAEANNFALVRAARLREFVLFLNQDTISSPGWIDACLECLSRFPHLGAVSPIIRTYDDSGYDPSFLDCLEDKNSLEGNGAALIPSLVAPAPALLARLEALRRSGPFDPIFGSYYEDYDLCRRLARLGYALGFCRTATLRHFSGSATDSPAKERRRMRLILRNRLIYQLRHTPRPRWRGLAAHFFFDLPRRLVRGLARTPSSQPPAVVLGAQWDLFMIFPRLISRRRDELAWRRYLDRLEWPAPAQAAQASKH
jgi:N-acetylglucosaminyl-diphospho-decaprenol L-rhamnosyltransferase